MKAKTQKITSITIDRAKWGFGNNGGFLLNLDNNKRCCLGFVALKSGFKPCDIRNVGMPDELVNKFPIYKFKKSKKLRFLLKFESGIEYDNSDICNKLSEINDEIDIALDKRENHITNLFSEVGVKVKFVGEVGK